MVENPSDDKIKEILKNKKVVAVVGLSPKPERASNDVASYLKEKGYKIIPVNPGHEEILGEKAYPSLADIPEKVDIVDVFRRSEHTGPIIDEAISIDADVIWLQQGIRNDEAAQKALEAGKTVVQDRCMLQEHRRLM
ncbi:MAG: CoA-binding protein [candidate division Zixibacteria bacterium]|nr:CoA-binding protein [candidate division Zixibacteria bacterium]NIR62205.1 CoA-binding protein [candidate division Zixibacteria bacterium]NIS14701.1 CoA-binding protein [candidate division Zixibacteria bacterium]NIS44445.1 CoA-binding protein [candidate division Zixibacteria bacterium]NIT51229.1 CoA-binding protein [candidate division Zixibacteria bacterium]